MAKIIRFTPSPSEDVVGYRLMMEPAGTPITTDTLQIDLGSPTPGADGKVQVDLSTIMTDIDGLYDIAIVAVDDAGNVSAPVGATSVPFDFIPPAPISDLVTV